jgi:hypothetical protein
MYQLKIASPANAWSAWFIGSLPPENASSLQGAELSPIESASGVSFFQSTIRGETASLLVTDVVASVIQGKEARKTRKE